MTHPNILSRNSISAVDWITAEAASLVNGNERWENEGGHIGPFLRVSLPSKRDSSKNIHGGRVKLGQSACNLYRLASGVAEVGAAFHVHGDAESNASEFVRPGAPGLVIANGKVRSMTWGMPMKQNGAGHPQIVNNAATHRLKSEFWRDSFELRRCLIPINAFEIRQGANGQVRPIWIAIKDQPMFACAGIWRDSDEWGPVYALIMTFRSDKSRPLRDGMPVILDAADYDIWLNGSMEAASKLCVPFEKEMAISFTTGP